MELHYDQLHLEKYLASGKTGNKRRSSQVKVFSSIAQAHRLKLCQRISLPDSIKQIFRCPAHEDKWDKLEEARWCGGAAARLSGAAAWRLGAARRLGANPGGTTAVRPEL